jgi:ADP-heptose:LPS heptosyltransferase
MLSDEKQILDQLQTTKFDIIIDLNSNFHLGISRLISLLKADLKVGFSTPFSDQFYNIQLDISKSGVMEKGFKQVNRILAL